jgi:magnesium-transporting ATPase (P-type)
MIFLSDITTEVSFAIPTTRKSEDDSLTLTITHEVTKSVETITLASSEVEVKETMVIVTTTLSSTLPSGQYRYNLSDESGTLSEGLMQVGDLTPTNTEYNHTKTTYVYEG